MASRMNGGTVTWLYILIRAMAVAGLAAASHTAGCENKTAPASTTPPTDTKVTIAGKAFTLETALTASKQFKGLSGRTDIPADGGMIFVFPFAQERYFVMRDCPIPIDIVYLDAKMKVTATHEMVPEPPSTPAELVTDADGSNAYEKRLHRYHSKFPAMYVLEFKAGTIKSLNLKEGQKIEIDPTLKKWSR